jgi:hypothetical protein
LIKKYQTKAKTAATSINSTGCQIAQKANKTSLE